MIKQGTPYVLPGSTYGEAWKSLKELGLDTAKPGVYRITGVYLETAQEAANFGAERKPVKIWGGNIATNTVEVTVR